MIRRERTIEVFSRGAELIQAICRMWEANKLLKPGAPDVNKTINARINAIVQEYDLTVAEWHYWCRHATVCQRAAD